MGLLLLHAPHRSCFFSLLYLLLPFLFAPHHSCLLFTITAYSSPLLPTLHHSCLLLTAPACSSPLLFAPPDTEYAVSGPPSHLFCRVVPMRLLFGLTLSPILQGGAVLTSLRSHPLIDSTGWCRCVPLSVSTSHQFEKVSWWSNEWTTGKGIRSKSVLVVQRVDHRAKVLASYRSHPLTDSEGWFRFDVPSVPPPHRFGRVVPMRKRRPMGNPSETPSAKEWRRLTGCLTQTYVKTTWGCSRCLRCTGKGETAAKLHVKTTWGSSHCPRGTGKGETKAKLHVKTTWGAHVVFAARGRAKRRQNCT